MATFDESQVTSLAEIFTTNSSVMGSYLSMLTHSITDSDKTAILADITAYQAIEDDNVSIDPRERNFGARINPSSKRSTIKNRIAGLIGWEVSSGARRVRA